MSPASRLRLGLTETPTQTQYQPITRRSPVIHVTIQRNSIRADGRGGGHLARERGGQPARQDVQ